MLSEVHIAYYQDLTVGACAAIAAGRFAEFHAATQGWDRPTFCYTQIRSTGPLRDTAADAI